MNMTAPKEPKALMARHLHPALQDKQSGGSAYTLDDLYRLAQVCHTSGLFEDVTDASQALIKIVKGQEMGIPPMAAMAAFDLIKKRMFIKPWVLAAKINTCGYGSFIVEEQTPERCTIVFSRKYPGRGWRDCVPCHYTIDEAKKHGLVERSPHWKASPAHMLYQRCLGRGAAMYFPELIAGMDVPQDDTPIPTERHQRNITDLFGDEHQDPTSHVQSTTKSATSDPSERLSTSAIGLQNSEPPERLLSESGASIDVEILRHYQADARLPQALRQAIALALTAEPPESGAHLQELVGAVADYLSAGEEGS